MSALAEIQRRIQSTADLIQQHESAARQPGAPPSVFASIRALEKLRRRLEREFEEIASQAVVDGLGFGSPRATRPDGETPR